MNLQCLYSLSCLTDLKKKQHFHVKMDFWIAILCPDSLTLVAFHSKSMFYWRFDVINDNHILILNAMSYFKKILHHNWAERTAISEIAKRQFLTFDLWSNWSFLMCESQLVSSEHWSHLIFSEEQGWAQRAEPGTGWNQIDSTRSSPSIGKGQVFLNYKAAQLLA